MHFAALLTTLLFSVPAAVPATAAKHANTDDKELLCNAGLSTEGPALTEFLRLRARLEVDPRALSALTDDLSHADVRRQTKATGRSGRHTEPARFLFGARPPMDFGDADRAARARRCLRWIEGAEAAGLSAAVVRVLVQQRPEKAVEALLDYLPAADSDAVLEEVANALTALAYVEGKPHAALVAALGDALSLRRAIAGRALCRRDQPVQFAMVRPLLGDPRPGVRLRAALALLAADDAEAVPVLIDLLAELLPAERALAEEALQKLAGTWAALAHQPLAKMTSPAVFGAIPGPPGGATPTGRRCWPNSAAAP